MSSSEKIKIHSTKLAKIKKLIELDYYGSVDDFIDQVIEYNHEIFEDHLEGLTFEKNWEIVEKLVELGHFNSTKELIDEGIDDILWKYNEDLENYFEIEQEETKKETSSIQIGGFSLGKKTLKKWIKKGQKKRIVVIGSLSIRPNVSARLLHEAVVSIKVVGRLKATDEQRAAIKIIKHKRN
jgi:Arc/MetJ-type ribon-helix-helix transcriptional regulator